MASSTIEERQPLLNDAATTAASLPTTEATCQPVRPLRVIVPGAMMLFLSEWCRVFISVSMGALMERSICQRRYADVVDSLHDPRCKGDDVQAELSIVRGWESSFILMPAILTAIPYNMMAETRGPKAVVLLMLAGQWLTHATELIVCLNPHIFNTRWVWVCAMFVVVGGGPVVLSAMVHYIGSNISTENNRATTFFYCTAIQMLGGLTAGPAGYLSMRLGPVFTKCLVLVFGTLMFCLQLSMPSAAIKRKKTPPPSHGIVDNTSPLRRAFSTWKQGTWDFHALISSDYKVGLLLLTTAFYTIATYSGHFRLQYVTKRFGWTWDAASFIPSIASGIKLAMVGAILPASSYLLIHRCKFSGMRKDVWLCRVLVLVLMLGSFALTVAPTGPLFIIAVCVYELSAGHIPATMSLIASTADEKNKGVVFGYAAVFEAIGGMLSGPILATLFNLGLKWGTKWYGLPFMFVGALQVISLIILFTAP